MKELKNDGVIYIPDKMTLQQFCEKFNEIMDKYDFGFSGGIKEIETDNNN